MEILVIVFLPLIAAIVAGLTNKAAPSVFAKSITTGALFISAALSWPIFLGFVCRYIVYHFRPSERHLIRQIRAAKTSRACDFTQP